MYYAHTGISEKSILPQTYEDHVRNVVNRVRKDLYLLSPFLQKSVLIAAMFHDLGKLSKECQEILCQRDRVEGVGMMNHVDAGVCYCLSVFGKTNDIAYLYAAYLILAHHIGLHDQEEVFSKKIKSFGEIEYEIKQVFRDNNIKDYIDAEIDNFVKIHLSYFKDDVDKIELMEYKNAKLSSLNIRMALSILVAADHGDTSEFYGGMQFNAIDLKPQDRLDALYNYVEKLKKSSLEKGISEEVVASRSELFHICNTIDISRHNFFLCAAPVGKGKTLSLMCLALRIAKNNNRKRVYFIIPFSNIISQSVKVYRDSISLDGEDSNYIVNEIHTKVEFSSPFLRKYSQEWNAPVNVSTSVQFFNSLYSNKPSALKKLKSFANSVVVFDEFHTAIPHNNWKVAIQTLKEASEMYNIDFVFGSGSHVMYWEIFDLSLDVLNVVDNEKFKEFKKYENERVNYISIGCCKNEQDFKNKFKERVVDANGNLTKHTIIVANTIANAVNLTKLFLIDTNWKIFHLSSHICPSDREVILDDIKKALKGEEKILVVSTSIIECGVDISFQYSFREGASMMSTIQLGGRTNRNKEFTKAIVCEFYFAPEFLSDESNTYTQNYSLLPCIKARRGYSVDADNCTNVIQDEVDVVKAESYCQLENSNSFDTMNKNFQVIEAITKTVIIDPEIVKKIKEGEFVSPSYINRNSISILEEYIKDGGKWSHWVEYFDADDSKEICYWIGKYDKEMFGIHINDI